MANTVTLPVTSLRATVPSDPQKTITIRIIRLSDCAIPKATIQTYVTRLKERYAQVGITLNVPTPVEAVVPMDLGVNGSLVLAAGSKISPSAKLLIERFGTLANHRNDIHIIYCKDTTSDGVRVKGFAWNKEKDEYSRNAFIGSVDPYMYTLAHEVGHLVTKSGHFGPDDKPGNYEPYAANHLVQHNLMRAGTLPFSVINSTKRLYQRQENMIFENEKK